MVVNDQARAEQSRAERLKDLASTTVALNAPHAFALLLAENNEVQNALAQVTAGANVDSVVQELQNRLGFSDARKEMIRDAMVAAASMAVGGKAGRGSAGGAKGVFSVKNASGVELPKNQSQMIASFEKAGYSSKPVISPTSGKIVGVQYIMPDGSRVRVMQADGRSPQRGSFENANGGPIDPTAGKPPQPPKGLSKAERKQWIREKTHIEQVE